MLVMKFGNAREVDRDRERERGLRLEKTITKLQCNTMLVLTVFPSQTTATVQFGHEESRTRRVVLLRG